MAKGLRKSIKQSTHTRAGKKLGRVFVDLSGPKVVESLGRKRYTLDDFSRYTWVYFMRHKSDAAELFKHSSRILAQTMSLRKWSSSDRTGVVSSAGGCLETCVEDEGSSRNSRRRTVPSTMG